MCRQAKRSGAFCLRQHAVHDADPHGTMVQARGRLRVGGRGCATSPHQADIIIRSRRQLAGRQARYLWRMSLPGEVVVRPRTERWTLLRVTGAKRTGAEVPDWTTSEGDNFAEDDQLR